MGVDGEGRPAGVAHGGIAQAQVEDGIFDVELDGRGLAFELDDLVGARERVDGGAQEVVGGVAVEIAVGLGQGDQLGGAAEGVEGEGAVLLRQPKIFGDLGREGGAVGLLLEQLGVDGGSLLGIGVGVGGVGCGLGVLPLPAVGRVEVDQRDRNLFFGSPALGADVVHDLADGAVAHDDLIAAVLEE